MEQLDFALLEKLVETPGAPGFESRIRRAIQESLSGYSFEINTDPIGNLIVFKKGSNNPEGYRVLVSAHMDEIGFIVTHIDDNGFIRFNPLGGFDPKTLTSQRVWIHGKEDVIGVMGAKPIHVMNADERNKPAKIEDFFIDTGLSKVELEAKVQVGAPITRQRELIRMGECVNGKSLDNRISVYVLTEALRRLANCPYDLYAVFSVQEEVGLRGAQVAAHTINPHFALALDTTIAYDTPGAPAHERCTTLGGGTAIKILDASTICDERMVAFLKDCAEKAEIKWQPEVLTAGGTDTSPLQRFGKNGSIAGAISIPTRYIHQVIETCHSNDVMLSVRLLLEALAQMPNWNWQREA
jgi:putative aminopeptidase FrvX